MGVAHREQRQIPDVTQAWRKLVTQQMTKPEDVVGETGRIGVVLLKFQFATMVEQPVQDIGCVPRAGDRPFTTGPWVSTALAR